MASITSPEQGAQQECNNSLDLPSGSSSLGRSNVDADVDCATILSLTYLVKSHNIAQKNRVVTRHSSIRMALFRFSTLHPHPRGAYCILGAACPSTWRLLSSRRCQPIHMALIVFSELPCPSTWRLLSSQRCLPIMWRLFRFSRGRSCPVCQNLHNLRIAQTCRSAAHLRLATGLMRAMRVALNYPNSSP